MRRKERTLSRRSFGAYFSGRHSSSATRLSELVSLVPEFFWIAALAVFIGYIVFGLIGSGAAYIVVPVISHVWAPTFLLPVADTNPPVLKLPTVVLPDTLKLPKVPTPVMLA